MNAPAAYDRTFLRESAEALDFMRIICYCISLKCPDAFLGR